jgi:hypothetical protein
MVLVSPASEKPAAKRWFRLTALVLGQLLLSMVVVFIAGEIWLRYRSTPDFSYRPPHTFKRCFISRTYQGRKVRFLSSDHPMHPGRKRVLVQGDSLTWGSGLHHWQDLYANRLEVLLNQKGPAYEVSVFATSGREIDGHLKVLREVGASYQPDVIVYQWLLNDMELCKENRPRPQEGFWCACPFHGWMKDHSYLWYYLDNRLRQIFYMSRPYTRYLLDEFAPCKLSWSSFEFLFRQWLAQATRLSNRTIVFLYPGTKMQGSDPKDYSLQRLHSQLAQTIQNPCYRWPAANAPKGTGRDIDDPDSFFGKVRQGRPGDKGTLVFGPYVNLPAGRHKAVFHLRLDAPAPGPVAGLDVAAQGGRLVLAQKKVSGGAFTKPGCWQEFELEFSAPPQGLEKVEFRVEYLGTAPLSVDYIVFDWPLPHPVELIDGAPFILPLRTWASPYDSHPNPLAHKVIARLIYEQIQNHNRP